MIVTLTGRDISKIAISLGLDTKQILRAIDFYVPIEGEYIPEGLKHIPQTITEKGPAILALKKDDTGACIFLKDDLCMIHEIRPSACVSFPFVFSNESDGIKWGLSAMKKICPGIGQGPIVDENELLEIASSVLEDLEIFREFSEEWNSSSVEHKAEDLIREILKDIRFIV